MDGYWVEQGDSRFYVSGRDHKDAGQKKDYKATGNNQYTGKPATSAVLCENMTEDKAFTFAEDAGLERVTLEPIKK